MYFYIINKNRYGRIRNLFGSEAVSVEYAYNNALRVINFEKFFGFFIEEKIQVYLRKYKIYREYFYHLKDWLKV